MLWGVLQDSPLSQCPGCETGMQQLCSAHQHLLPLHAVPSTTKCHCGAELPDAAGITALIIMRAQTHGTDGNLRYLGLPVTNLWPLI